MSLKGYSGMCVEYPSSCHSMDDMVEYLHKQVKLHKLTPPVMVAHSMASFVAQKYLESYALAALVLVNPIPPATSASSINLLQNQWKSSVRPEELVHNSEGKLQIMGEQTQTGTYLDSCLRSYYSLSKEADDNSTEVEQILGETFMNTSTAILSNTNKHTEHSYAAQELQPFAANSIVLQKIITGRGVDDVSVQLEPGMSN